MISAFLVDVIAKRDQIDAAAADAAIELRGDA